VVAKLNEAIAEVSNLASQLTAERDRVKVLTEEKYYMLGTMEDMREEGKKNQRSKNKMEDLMEETQGKLRAMQEELEIEKQLRMASEAKLNQLLEAQAALQQSIMDDEMQPKQEILQPLLTNYSH